MGITMSTPTLSPVFSPVISAAVLDQSTPHLGINRFVNLCTIRLNWIVA